jgi:predicted solute-binding protein
MLHGSGPADGKDVFDLRFALPSECADQIASGDADIGIVPVIEMARQKLEYFPGTGIACHGPVRSILLVSKVPFPDIRTLATDSGSRTSVMLARIILAEKFGLADRFGTAPRLISRRADLATMLGEADAALLIGDPALRVDPMKLPFETLDLGSEWVSMTGLPMVFAVWAGRKEMLRPEFTAAFNHSCQYGLTHMNEIVAAESAGRDFSEAVVRDYLTSRIVFELGQRDYEGLEFFLEKASRLDTSVSAFAAEGLSLSGGLSQ